jgi:hypothetical protein
VKRQASVDLNQPEIVAALRKIGCSVQHLHTLGKGVPDLLVGRNGWNFVIEVKNGKLPPSKRKLTPDEQEWHDAWRGFVFTVYSADDAIERVLAYSHQRCVIPLPPRYADGVFPQRTAKPKL